MALANRAKKEPPRIGFKKSKNMLLPGTTLAAVESLSMPLVCTPSLYADFYMFELLVVFS